MKKILMILFILSLLMAGMAVGGEIVGTRSNKVTVPNKVTTTDKVKIPDKGAIPDTVLVPNVLRLPLMQAVAVLEQNGLQLDDRVHKISESEKCEDNTGNRKGNVGYQEPDAGTRVARHSSVILGTCN